MATILIIEDEKDISDLVAYHLKKEGFETIQAFNGNTGYLQAKEFLPHLIILDLMLPEIDGITLYKEFSNHPKLKEIPVIMLTAKSQTEDRINGLSLGADDYITKPFSPKELVLRVQSLLRRSYQSQPALHKQSTEGIGVNPSQLTTVIKGEEIELTSIEFKLFSYLLERANHTQSRHDILKAIWGYSDQVNSRTLDSHMKRLRQKLNTHSDIIETIRGVGYRLSLKK